MPKVCRSTNLLICASILLLQSNFASGAETEKLQARMQLSQVAREKWTVEYVFFEPIRGLIFEKAGDYREKAWTIISPDVVRHEKGDHEVFSATRPTTKMQFEMSAYAGFEPKNYAPNIRFSDGGANVYIGFFHGSAMLAKGERELEIKTSMQALPGETLLEPAKIENSDKGDYAYAYFGPQKPALVGDVRIIIDPITPLWLRDLIINISDVSSHYYEETYHRKLSRPLSLTAGISDLESNGFSIKGGATNGQINYLLSGKILASQDPKIQAKLTKMIQRVVAHEMAHIWQNDVSKGGIGEEAPWIHEGGAELMAMDALLKKGLWSKSDVDSYTEKNTQECASLKANKNDYRYAYACGIQNFLNYKLDIPTFWQALINETEQSGATYSESMLEKLALRLRSDKTQ